MANKGNYYKVKTKRYLEKQGYHVEYLEKMQRIVTKGGKTVFIKRDLFGADLLAVNSEQVVFVNVTTKSHVSEHVKRFKAVPFPRFVDVWVLLWEARQKEPEIVEVE